MSAELNNKLLPLHPQTALIVIHRGQQKRTMNQDASQVLGRSICGISCNVHDIGYVPNRLPANEWIRKGGKQIIMHGYLGVGGLPDLPDLPGLSVRDLVGGGGDLYEMGPRTVCMYYPWHIEFFY